MKKSIELMEAENALMEAMSVYEQKAALIDLIDIQQQEADEEIRLAEARGVKKGMVRAAAVGIMGLGLSGGISKLLARS